MSFSSITFLELSQLEGEGEVSSPHFYIFADDQNRSAVTLALTVLTSSQAILIVWSKRAGKYEYSVTTANFLVEALKCAISLAALARIWRNEGVTEDNKLSTSWDEVSVYPIPAALYLIKNLLQAIIKKRPSRNINVQKNFWLYVFGMAFNAMAILVQDFDAVMNNGIAVSMVMKYADNIVKVKTIYILSDWHAGIYSKYASVFRLPLGGDLHSYGVDHGPILPGGGFNMQ
ncbi:Uncharacterized protein Fot_52404 [Forsythia ovata]|uniref:Uncharacterized protein n=1 Tax=Forsythia ovata TaxID=205694 RepID=A0ABD1PKL4_9LAMI